MNLARLNHILIPEDAAKREAWRTGRVARLARPIGWFYTSLSEEGRVASVMCLFLGSMAVDVARTQVFVLWSALVGAVIGALLFRSRYSMQEASLTVTLPEHVVAGEPFDATLTLVNTTGRDVFHIRTRRPFLSWDGNYADDATRLATSKRDQRSQWAERITFSQRGLHDLGRFSCVELVPPGLSVGAAISTARSQLLVYPRPANVAALALPGDGQRQEDDSTFVRSLDGEPYEVRPYRVGDRVRDLHAKTWARTAVPHVRQYMQPSSTRALLILDVDATLANEITTEAVVSVAAGIAEAAAAQGIDVTCVVCGNDSVDTTHGTSVMEALALCAPAVRVPKRRVQAHAPNVSAAWVITAEPDDQTRALVRTLETDGVGCSVVAVRQDADPESGVVAVADVAEQKELSL